MMNISVNYMGLNLKSPIIVGSSGLTNSVQKIKELEANGAGAVVLKSLFEEQLISEAFDVDNKNEHDYPEALDYINFFTKDSNLTEYLKLIRESKKEVDIPIIASINCVSSGEWVNFAKKMEEAGADGLELNISLLPSDVNKTSDVNEKMYFTIIEKVKSVVKIPIALKMSHYSAGLANLIQKLSWTENVDAFVLFNRYYSPDIDIKTLKISSTGVFSSPGDIAASLRWVALLSDKIDVDIAASTGVHTGEDLIKQLLAGATAVQVVSAIYLNHPSIMTNMLEELMTWMKAKKYKSISEFQATVNLSELINPAAFERIQFMKYFGNIK
jgi:dihydroorotate dehydrogenase (fumarate)